MSPATWRSSRASSTGSMRSRKSAAAPRWSTDLTDHSANSRNGSIAKNIAAASTAKTDGGAGWTNAPVEEHEAYLIDARADAGSTHRRSGHAALPTARMAPSSPVRPTDANATCAEYVNCVIADLSDRRAWRPRTVSPHEGAHGTTDHRLTAVLPSRNVPIRLISGFGRPL